MFEDEKQVTRVLDWLANALKQKNIVIQLWVDDGATGKTSFINHIVKPLFGSSNCALNLGQTDVSTQFNSHFIEKQINYWNEIKLDKPEDVNYFKQMSEDEIFVEGKGKGRKAVPSPMNHLISSNTKEGFSGVLNERRFDVLELTKLKFFNHVWFWEKYAKSIKTDEEKYARWVGLMEDCIPFFYSYLYFNHKITTNMSDGMKAKTKVMELLAESGEEWQRRIIEDLLPDAYEEYGKWITIEDIQMFLKDSNEEYKPPGWKKILKFITVHLQEYLRPKGQIPGARGTQTKIEVLKCQKDS